MRTTLTNGIKANTHTSQGEINEQMKALHEELTRQLKQADRTIKSLL